ncbi:RHS repeat-associated core domain-containing protein [Flavivirga abyssicola]|uniref:RHS repeat domain-containing protein n=1 Tax=Flavivirga abyssicola TaxID=3063533 RepID=UPI0026DECF7A|nr:RHS repeat-associated core domain-containing protein [Flavivirga sp. MEBiC07777]WVK14920.1 RHS repeat-associated core domain-containing protein [Flavivirga sp. MEBiC07777]
MEKYIKNRVRLMVLFILTFIINTSLSAQNCFSTTLSQSSVQFSLSGGTSSINVSFPLGCSNPTISVDGAPSWLTTSVSGTTINLSCGAASSYRTVNLAVRVNGNIVNGFGVKQGTAPPPPACSISGLPSSIDINRLGETLDYTLTFSNCSPSYLTFESATGGPVPSWLTVTQPSSSTVRIQCGINDTSISRSFILLGTKSGGGSVGAFISQDKCEVNWYVDSDGDSFGDAFGVPVVSCTDPSDIYISYVQNNDDVCPEIPGPDSGCPLGQVPEDMNWITSKSYDINGNLKASSKAYFNDLGKSIQSQSVDIKTGDTWASSTLYDVQGRPALSTLSAPINSTGDFLYKSDFIRNSANNTYSSSDFEPNPETPDEVATTTTNTLGWYYSTNNDDTRQEGNTYQDITSHPFSRTIYSELNPGTALKIIGGNKQNGEWKQSYTFSMPAGDELTHSIAFNDASYKVVNDRKIIKTISKDAHNNEVVVFTDTDGKTLAAARTRAGTSRSTIIDISTQGYVDVHVPVGATGFTIDGVSGITTEVYDLITEQPTTAATNALPSGFYRVSITNLDNYNPINSETTVHINCKENYYDYSLNEYDEAGRLKASYQPVGNTKAQKPVTTYSYNALGQLLSTTSPDEGTANFKYRRDGQIRFSQNSKQLANTEFSYTNYDALGRPIESGVFNEGTVTFANSDNIVNNIDDPITPADEDGLPNASCSEQQFTTYDTLDASDIAFLGTVNSSYGAPSFLAGNVAKTSNANTTTYYSYDVYGRVEWVVQSIPVLGTKTIDYKYDQITGAVTEVDYQKYSTINDRFIHHYTYNAQDNSLIKVETSTNGSSYTTHADYKYYETGALKQVDLATLSGTPLQTIDYVYNLNGQLKAINPGNDANDLFSMQIDYHSSDYTRSVSNISTPNYGQDQFNGNIKGVRWKNKEIDNTEQTYSYYYNKNNWLSDAIYGQYAKTGGDGSKVSIIDDNIYESGTTTNLKATSSITLLPDFHAKSGATLTANISGIADSFQSGDYNVSDITYDANGNIRTLNRNKNTSSGSNSMDQLSYNYDPTKPNQLLRVDDAAGTVLEGKDIGDQDGENYEYNEIGQLVKNNAEGIEYVYNASGLVTEVKKNSLPLVKFFYNDKGYRVKKEIYTGSSLTRTDYYIRDASGTALAIYEDTTIKEHTIYGASRLGVYNRGDGSSYYQLTDHLGNVRAIIGRASDDTPIAMLSSTDYYPFGMPMPNRDNGENSYRYAYQGQEKDPETGKEAFELRLWDSRIGRWLTTDPAGQYASPYLGMGNNPLNLVDLDGAFAGPPPDWVSKDGKNFYWDSNITSEAQAKEVGLIYGGKTISETIKRMDSPYILNWFESLPNFDLKSFYEPLVKDAYYESLSRHVVAQKNKNNLLEIARKNRDELEFENILNKPALFAPVDLSFASQFAPGKNYASFNTVLEWGNESYKVLIRVQNVHKENRFADRINFIGEPGHGSSAVGKGSKLNWYQHRLGESEIIRVIFGPKNIQGYRNFGSQ